jgi:hypothetical protein
MSMESVTAPLSIPSIAHAMFFATIALAQWGAGVQIAQKPRIAGQHGRNVRPNLPANAAATRPAATPRVATRAEAKAN